MKRVAAAVAVVIGVLAAFTGRASAITGGELDGDRHPNVAMIVFYQPDGRFRCSATLVSPTVLVTAAHCTDGVRGKLIASSTPWSGHYAARIRRHGHRHVAPGYTKAPCGLANGYTSRPSPLGRRTPAERPSRRRGGRARRAIPGAAPARLAPLNYLERLSQGNGGLNNRPSTSSAMASSSTSQPRDRRSPAQSAT